MSGAGKREHYDMQIRLLTVGNTGAWLARGLLALHCFVLLTPPVRPPLLSCGFARTLAEYI